MQVNACGCKLLHTVEGTSNLLRVDGTERTPVAYMEGSSSARVSVASAAWDVRSPWRLPVDSNESGLVLEETRIS